jgi:hypothetical protein
MKNLNHLFIAFFLFISHSAISQEVIRLQSCTNDMIAQQADSLKNLYTKDGYVLLKEASITMQSEFEMRSLFLLPKEAGTSLFLLVIILPGCMK